MSGFRVLAVCTGNVHRSPLAAVMIERWVEWYLPPDLADEVTVSSAGTRPPVGARIGSLPGVIAESLGGDARAHRARRVTDKMVADADLVLAASRGHRDELLMRVPSAMRRTFTIREAGRIAERLPDCARPATEDDLRRTVAEFADSRVPPEVPGDDDIIDPQGLADSAYLQMANEEVPALAALAVTLLGMHRGDLAEYRAAAGDAARLGIPGSAT